MSGRIPARLEGGQGLTGGSWEEVPEQGQVLIRLNADESTGDEVGEAVGPGLVCSRRDWL